MKALHTDAKFGKNDLLCTMQDKKFKVYMKRLDGKMDQTVGWSSRNITTLLKHIAHCNLHELSNQRRFFYYYLGDKGKAEFPNEQLQDLLAA